MELLFLDETYDLHAALRLAEGPDALGVAEKASAGFPRYAIRFRSASALATFADAKGIPNTAIHGRWKVTGLPATCGIAGLAKLLHSRGWVLVEILFLATWSCSLVHWPEGSPCARFQAQGRLCAIQVHVGAGDKQLLFYCIYGPSGARWNETLRKQTHKILESVMQDSAGRGLPAIMGGDFNLERGDSDVLQRLPQLGWTNFASMFDCEFSHTCFKGRGSTIDFAYGNRLATCALTSFRTGSRHGLADHLPLHFELDVGIAAQTVGRSRTFGTCPAWRSVHVECLRFVLHDHMLVPFRSALRHGDVEHAYRLWSSLAEQCLQSIWRCTGTADPFTQGRGTVRVVQQVMWPHSKHDAAVGLEERRLWRRICRLLELTKRPHGYKAELTWRAALDFRHASAELRADAAQFHLRVQGARLANDLLAVCNAHLRKLRGRAKTARLAAWKSKLQSSQRAQHEWLRHDGDLHASRCFRGPDGVRTANIRAQFRAVRTSWAPITELFANGEPEWDTYWAGFGRYVPHTPAAATDCTGEKLRSALATSSPSAGGLDGWGHEELCALSKFFPMLFDELATLLTSIEQQGVWPSALVSGFSSLIPKQEQAEDPTDLRPLTVLSAIYRLWARMRALDLADWQERWAHPDLWGGRPGRNAETMVTSVCLDLEESSPTLLVAGVSYDLSKAFDRVPWGLLLRQLSALGMPTPIWQAYAGMLRGVTRRWKLGPALDAPVSLSGGILQGCPLSMMAMNSMMHPWIAALNAEVACRPRAYVDDLSLTASGIDAEELRTRLQEAHALSHVFVESTGARINAEKSVTFGNPCVAGHVHDTMLHSVAFRLVGGSVVARGQAHVTAAALEFKHLAAWRDIILRARHLPVGWKDRTAALLRTRSTFTWGNATHSLALTGKFNQEVTKTRSAVLRTLLRRSQYNVSPLMYFTIVASPSLNPHYCMIADGLLMIARAMRNADVRARLLRLYHGAHGLQDGPVARLKQINALSGFQGVSDKLVMCDPNSDLQSFMHDVREGWRLEQWRKVARDRPAFRGIETDVRRTDTLRYLKELDAMGQCAFGVTPSLQQEDARMCAAVLRLLLCGGLFTRDVIQRHVKGAHVMCDCERSEVCDVGHVSWRCTHYHALRAPLEPHAARIAVVQPCFAYATLLTDADADLAPLLPLVQQVLVGIWRLHIKKYLYADDYINPSMVTVPLGQATSSSVSIGLSSSVRTTAHATAVGAAVVPDVLHENGHAITKAVGGGAYCKRCGIFVARAQQRVLKISRKRCAFAAVPESQWLDAPGRDNNPHRLLSLLLAMDRHHGTHEIAWNGSASRVAPVGRLECLQCAASWPWDNRHNAKRAECRAGVRRATPERYISLRMAKAQPDIAIARLAVIHEVSMGTPSTPLAHAPQVVVPPLPVDLNSLAATRLLGGMFDDMG